jgi:hypothetical protein
MKYKEIRINGKLVYLHRHLIEEKLGRKLAFDEVVHHVNGDVLDNRIENLQLMTSKEHAIHHGTGRKCKTEAKERIAKSLKGTPNYSRARYTKKHLEEWQEMINLGVPVREISRRTGISRTTIVGALNGKTLAYLPENLSKTMSN